jgi:hypothetical protein
VSSIRCALPLAPPHGCIDFAGQVALWQLSLKLPHCRATCSAHYIILGPPPALTFETIVDLGACTTPTCMIGA